MDIGAPRDQRLHRIGGQLAVDARRREQLGTVREDFGPPHSSVSMCASSWQITEWYDWHSDDSASELAAVPLNTKKTSQSVWNRLRMRSQTCWVQESSP